MEQIDTEHDDLNDNKITEESLNDMDFGALLSLYTDQQHMYSFEGNSGMEKLNTLCETLGYREDGFKFGSALEKMLTDNPGACEAIVEWIRETGDDNDSEWADGLRDSIEIDEDEDEEDDEC